MKNPPAPASPIHLAPASPLPPAPSPPKKPSKGRFGPASALVVTLLAYLGSQIVALISVTGIYSLATHTSSDKVLREFTDSTTGQFAFIAVAEVLTLGIIYWFIRSRHISLAEIGFGRWPKLSDAGYAIVFAVGYFIVTLIAMSLVNQLIPAIDLEQEQQIGFESASGTTQLGMVFLALVIFVPIAEEVLVRGFLYSGLRRKLSRIIAALLASLLFGAAHLQLGSGEPPLYVVAIDTFILSIFLIALREKTGSLWSGILVHAIKNGLAFMALFVFHIS